MNINHVPTLLLNTTDESLQSVITEASLEASLQQLQSIEHNTLLQALDTSNPDTIRQYLRALVPKSPFHDIENLASNPSLSKEAGELVLSVFFKPSPEDEVPRERFWIFYDLLLPKNMRTNRSRAGMFIGKFCKLPEHTTVGSKRNKVAVKNSQRMYLGMYGPTLDNASDKDVKRLAELLQLKSDDVLAFDAHKFIELTDKLLQLQVVTEKQVKQHEVVTSHTPALPQFPPVNTLRGSKQFVVLAEIAGKEGEDYQLSVNKRKRTWTIKGERRIKLPRLCYEQSDVHETEVTHYDTLNNNLSHDPHNGLLLVEAGLGVESEDKNWLKEEIFQGQFERSGEFPPEVDLSVTASKANQDGIQVWSWPVVSEDEIAQ